MLRRGSIASMCAEGKVIWGIKKFDEHNIQETEHDTHCVSDIVLPARTVKDLRKLFEKSPGEVHSNEIRRESLKRRPSIKRTEETILEKEKCEIVRKSSFKTSRPVRKKSIPKSRNGTPAVDDLRSKREHDINVKVLRGKLNRQQVISTDVSLRDSTRRNVWKIAVNVGLDKDRRLHRLSSKDCETQVTEEDIRRASLMYESLTPNDLSLDDGGRLANPELNADHIVLNDEGSASVSENTLDDPVIEESTNNPDDAVDRESNEQIAREDSVELTKSNVSEGNINELLVEETVKVIDNETENGDHCYDVLTAMPIMIDQDGTDLVPQLDQEIGKLDEDSAEIDDSSPKTISPPINDNENKNKAIDNSDISQSVDQPEVRCCESGLGLPQGTDSNTSKDQALSDIVVDSSSETEISRRFSNDSTTSDGSPQIGLVQHDDLMIFEERALCSGQSVEEEADEDYKEVSGCFEEYDVPSPTEEIQDPYKRPATWRTRAFRRLSSGFVVNEDEQRKKSAVWHVPPKTLYQHYYRRSDEFLRRSILESYENKDRSMAMNCYLLIRNGCEMTIRLMEDQCPADELSATEFATGPTRNLWQTQPNVVDSMIRLQLSKREIHLQEALFEILTSEASYVHSLIVLEKKIIKSIKSANILKQTERHSLFAYIEPICEAARLLFGDLIVHWKEDIMLRKLCSIVEEHYINCKDIYIKYAVKHTTNLNENYLRLLEDRPGFKALITELLDDRDVCKMPLESFLIMPLQRITRMPLLMKSVIAYTEPESDEHQSYRGVLRTLETIARDCNDELEKMRQYEEMMKLSSELKFAPDVHIFPLIQSFRHLVLRAKVRLFKNKSGKKDKDKLEIFLFNDMFVAAKKQNQNDKSIYVIDYCEKTCLVSEVTTVILNHRPPLTVVELTLLSNSFGEKNKFPVVFDLENDQQRWLDAMSPKPSPYVYKQKTELGSKGQMVAIEQYGSQRPDELTLEVGDIISIVEDETNGWFRGEKIVDGSVGWVASKHCKLITLENILSFNSTLRNQIRRKMSSLPTIYLDASVNDESRA